MHQKVLVKSIHKLDWEKQDALEICLLGIGESQNWRFDKEAQIHTFIFDLNYLEFLIIPVHIKTRGCFEQRIEAFSVWGLWAIDLRGHVQCFESVWALVITACVYTAACVAFHH